MNSGREEARDLARERSSGVSRTADELRFVEFVLEKICPIVIPFMWMKILILVDTWPLTFIRIGN